MAVDSIKAGFNPRLQFSYLEDRENPPRAERVTFSRTYTLSNKIDASNFGLGEYLLDFKLAREGQEVFPESLTQLNSSQAISEFNSFYATAFGLAKDRLQAKYSVLPGKYSRYKVVDDDVELRFLTPIDDRSGLGYGAGVQQNPTVLAYNVKDACELEDYNLALSQVVDGLSKMTLPGFTYSANKACFVPKDIPDEPVEEVFIQEFDYIQTVLQDNSTLFIVLQRKGLKNLVTMEVIPIEPPKFDEIKRIVIPAVILEPTEPSFYIYKKFKEKEIIADEFISKTYGVWGTNGELLNFYTSSTQADFDKQYMLQVVSSSCDVTNMFTIHYGDIDGYGTLNVSGSRNRRSYSKMIYSKYKNLCLEDNKQFILNDGFSWPSTPNENNLDFDGDLFQVDNTFYSKDNKFTQKFPTRKVNRIFALKVPRELYGDKLDEGNIELNFSRLNPSTIVPLDENFTFTLIDSSLDKNNATSSAFIQGSSYDLVSGSILQGKYNGNIETAYTSYGKFYPNMGLFILDADKLNSVLNLGLVSGSNSVGNNPYRIFASISGSSLTGVTRQNDFGFKLRKVDNQITSYYHVNIRPKDFNYSNNPTYVTDELFAENFATVRVVGYPIKNKGFITEPTTYITTIGLYNDNYELLAVGKLSKAIKKTDVDSKSFIVRLNTTNV